MGFGVKKDKESVETKDQQGFIRSKKDNPLLKALQVKGDLFDIVDENATLWADFDGVPFKCSSSVEEDYITVHTLLEEVIEDKTLVFQDGQEFKNRTEFKGRTKGDVIASGSALSDKNVAREVAGLKPYTMEDFELRTHKRLKFEKGTTIDGIKFENSFAVCTYFMDKWVEACLAQTRLKKIKVVLGSGITHRHAVLVPHQYKSTRSPNKPLLLDKAREYLTEKYDSYIAPPLLEADEVVDAMAARSYDKAMATGTKIDIVKAANDKDARSKRGALFDWAKSFHFNNPQCWLIEDFSKSVGTLEMKKGKVYGGGGVFFAYQILMSDSADEYSPRKYLPEDFVHYGNGYGDESFYKDFAPLKTAKCVFQKVVDKYLEWFPDGLKYVAWDGTEVHEDTLSYLQKHYQLAYMLEGKDDKSTVMSMLDKYEVDYSKLVNNHKPPTFPLKEEDGVREAIETLRTQIKESATLASDTKGTKPVLVKRLEGVVGKLKELEESLSEFFVVDKLKEGFGVAPKPVKKSLESIIQEYKKSNNDNTSYDENSHGDMEIFTDCLDGDYVWEGDIDRHRWYNVVNYVKEVNVDGVPHYFKCWYYDITGDGCAGDMDLDLPTLKDVYPVDAVEEKTLVFK